MAYVDDQMHGRWGARSGNYGATCAISNIDLGVSQVALMLDMILNLQGSRTAESEQADALTMAAMALLGQLGESIDTLGQYILDTRRSQAGGGAHPDQPHDDSPTGMESLAQAVFEGAGATAPAGNA